MMKLYMTRLASFHDLADLPGGTNEFRRVLLKRSVPFAGPFSKMLGQSV